MNILVLGVGNVMFADEGIGVHFVKMIERNYNLTSPNHTLNFVDGGTLANHLTHIIVKYDYVIVVDCIDATDAQVGSVYFFDFDDMPNSINWSGSAHEVEMLQTLQMMDLMGDRPITKVLGVTPLRIEPMSFNLSKQIRDASLLMEKMILKHLQELGFSYEKIANFTVDDIAMEWKKEQF